VGVVKVVVSPEKVSDHGSKVKGILDSFKPDFEKIEQVLGRHFASHIPFVNEICQYILFAEGKRLRPLLTVYAARLCGRDDEAVFDLSAVPEYLHAASLSHDDIVDGGVIRRGRSSAYKIWGNKATVLVGDFLYARAIELASRFGDNRIATAIAETVALMSEGEIIQLLQAKNPSFDEETYLEIIKRKTASLISASCKIGALLAGAGKSEIQALSDYGLYLGQAFQMIDDILDYTADASELGKAIGTDLAEGKITLPLVVAIEKASSREKEILLQVLRGANPSEEELVWVKNLLSSTGGLDYTRSRAKAMVTVACEGLETFASSETKDLLHGLAWFVLGRRK
jgi:octaprenyl-diphosphate synthase